MDVGITDWVSLQGYLCGVCTNRLNQNLNSVNRFHFPYAISTNLTAGLILNAMGSVFSVN